MLQLIWSALTRNAAFFGFIPEIDTKHSIISMAETGENWKQILKTQQYDIYKQKLLSAVCSTPLLKRRGVA
jgi:hypothetical protein